MINVLESFLDFERNFFELKKSFDVLKIYFFFKLCLLYGKFILEKMKLNNFK